jgi:hypothetical protein
VDEWQILRPALIAAGAAIGGVAVGALVEPLKLGAARRARAREDRAERCAKLVEKVMNCRSRLISLNRAHHQAVAGQEFPDGSEQEQLEAYRLVRNEFRQAVAMVTLSGPDALADAAMAMREAERQLTQRFAPDLTSLFDREHPGAVTDRAHNLEQAIHDFAVTARWYVT